jgi:acyl-CoA synthetase (AMP-forming)/AMP-acid ligase II
VEVLPTTPTFLHLLLLSEEWRRHDLSSLRLITYGTEVMPETTLRRIREALPGVDLQQTYGLSELGILRSKSRAADSLWVRIGGEGFETRVRDGLLEVRARSAMLGYLNAPSPFTEDGWFRTGDAVEVDGEYLRILGRRSEMINVGGEKVFPAEVETVLETMPGVEEASVTGEPSAITGQMVVARVRLSTGEGLAEFRARMRNHCRGLVAPFKVPQKVILAEKPMYGDRYKKIRRSPPS